MIASVFIILILLFEGSIENFIPPIKYIDEILVLIFFIISIFKLLKNKELRLKIKEIISFFLIIFYLFLGVVSNIQSELLLSTSTYLISGILSVKFILIYLFTRICFKGIKINYNFLRKLYNILNLILGCYVVVILFNIPFKFLESWGKRYGVINTVSAGFSYPAELDFLAISIMVIQLFLMIVLKKNIKYYKVICIESLVIILFSGRTKAMIFFILYICSLLIVKYLKKIKIKQLFFLTPFALIIADNRIQSEFVDNGGARGLLYNVAFKIANDFFPLGSGFGTYGTDISRKFYSPLYYAYGLSNKFGLSPKWPAFITDAQWAGIIGESGWIGFIIYLVILIILTNVIIKHSKEPLLKISISGLWIYGLISSISDTILTSYRGVAIALIISLLMSIIDEIHKKSNIT